MVVTIYPTTGGEIIPEMKVDVFTGIYQQTASLPDKVRDHC